MLEHFLALLVAPVFRRLIALVLVLMTAAFTVTIPARLWLLYVDATPSEPLLVILNAMSLVLLFVGLTAQGTHGRH